MSHHYTALRLAGPRRPEEPCGRPPVAPSGPRFGPATAVRGLVLGLLARRDRRRADAGRPSGRERAASPIRGLSPVSMFAARAVREGAGSSAGRG